MKGHKKYNWMGKGLHKRNRKVENKVVENPNQILAALAAEGKIVAMKEDFNNNSVSFVAGGMCGEPRYFRIAAAELVSYIKESGRVLIQHKL